MTKAKEVAAKTAEVAGDGTTTATVLAQALYVEGSRSSAASTERSPGLRGQHRRQQGAASIAALMLTTEAMIAGDGGS